MMKRFLDVVLSLFGLVVLSPLLAFIATALAITGGCPLLFRQLRPGRNGEPFELVKFRTMEVPSNADDESLSDEERLTAIGRFLRSYSLDELPELWNVLKGEMSLVGPRPLLMEYLGRYSPEQARRHEVRPGITGWAQVNGRNALTWEEKFQMDVWYVDNQSFWLDLKILALTVIQVFRRTGISQPGHATAEPFRGSEGGPNT